MTPHFLILAAGQSQRFLNSAGHIKALHQVHGRPWLAVLLTELLKQEAKITCVLGFHKEKILNALSDFSDQVEFVFNPRPANGAFASLQAGLKQIKHGQPLFIQPVDCPFLNQADYQYMLKQLGMRQVLKPTFQGKSGHPVLVSPRFQRELSVAPTELRLDFIIKNLAEHEKASVELNNPHILLNLNELNDFTEYRPGV